MAAGVESEAVNWCSSIVLRSGLFDIAEIKDSDLLVLSTSNNEVSSRRDSYCVDGTIMNLDTVLNVEGLVVPDLEVAVPANRGKVLSAN